MLLFEEVEEKTVWFASLYLKLGAGLCILVDVIFLFVLFIYLFIDSFRSTTEAVLRLQKTLA